MSDLFQAFELSDDGIRPKISLPAPIADQAKREAIALSVSTEEVTHAELEALAEAGLKLLEDCRSGRIPVPLGLNRNDSHASLLSGLADDAFISDQLSLAAYPERSYRPWHLMSAYTLLQLDRAARCASGNDADGAIEALCLAMESSRNATLWWTGDTIDAEVSSAGWKHAQESKRLKAIHPLKEYVFNRWKDGRDDGRPWKSKRSCALAIAADVVLKAKEHDWEISGKEPERTVYKWLREQSD